MKTLISILQSAAMAILLAGCLSTGTSGAGLQVQYVDPKVAEPFTEAPEVTYSFGPAAPDAGTWIGPTGMGERYSGMRAALAKAFAAAFPGAVETEPKEKVAGIHLHLEQARPVFVRDADGYTIQLVIAGYILFPDLRVTIDPTRLVNPTKVKSTAGAPWGEVCGIAVSESVKGLVDITREQIRSGATKSIARPLPEAPPPAELGVDFGGLDLKGLAAEKVEGYKKVRIELKGFLDAEVADFNNDGRPDFAILGRDEKGTYFLVFYSKGTEWESQSFNYGEGAGVLAVYDFNKDGFADLHFADSGSGEGNVINNKGGSFRGDIAVFKITDKWDADYIDVVPAALGAEGGIFTIIRSRKKEEEPVLWIFPDSGGSIGRQQQSSDIPWMVAGDLNGDGYDDLINGYKFINDKGNLEVLLTGANMKATDLKPKWACVSEGLIMSVGAVNATMGFIGISAADLNGDGREEIITASKMAAAITVLGLGTDGNLYRYAKFEAPSWTLAIDARVDASRGISRLAAVLAAKDDIEILVISGAKNVPYRARLISPEVADAPKFEDGSTLLVYASEYPSVLTAPERGKDGTVTFIYHTK